MLNMWQISWRNITQNKKRFFFSLLGIITGVAFITAMLIADKTTNDVFDYYEQMYVANADYWLLSDEYTFSEDVVSDHLNSPTVIESLFALDKQAFLDVSDKALSQQSVRITGVDNQASSLLKLPVIEGSLDNEGLVIPEALANLLDKRVGDTIQFMNLGEAKISAIVEYNQLLASPSDWQKAKTSNFRILAPLNLLREWTGMHNELSYVRVQTIEDGKTFFKSLQQAFSDSNVNIQPVVADDRQSNDIGGLYTFFYLIAGLSILVSGFIVFNMIYTSVMERKKEFAIMKSLGYLQSSVFRLVLIEVIILSIVGTIIGVPIGIWLGDIFMQTLLSLFEFDTVYTLHWQFPALIAVVIGIVFPVVFSLLPIYNAGKTSVLLTLKVANQTVPTKKQAMFRGIIGVGLLIFIFIDHFVSYLAILVSIILLFPFLLKGMSLILRPIFKVFLGYSGILATQSDTQQLNRNANTSAILAVGVAVILLLSSVIESAPEGYENEIRNTYGGDLRVTSESPWSSKDISMLLSYESVVDVVRLTEVTPITWETVAKEDRQFSILAVNEKGPALFENAHIEKTYQALQEKRSILLGKRAFDEWGGKVGDDIQLNLPSGTQKLEVIDVVNTSHHSGYVGFIDESYLNNEFGWTNSFDLLLTLNDKYDKEQFREQLWGDFNEHLSKIKTVEDEIKSTTSALYGANDLILMMLILVIGLASIGTANTLLMNTLERASEIGTMQAIGFTRQQIRKMIVGEGILIGLSGVFGGIVVGMILLYVTSTSQLLSGFISFQMPVMNIVVALVAALLLSLFASWISSMTASKINILSSLKEG